METDGLRNLTVHATQDASPRRRYLQKASPDAWEYSSEVESMDAVYRAADLAEAAATPGQSLPPRVVLDAKARRQRDKDSMRRARRKGYPAGLTSTTLDEWWSEVTAAKKKRDNTSAAPSTSAPSPPSHANAAAAVVDVDVMTGEQALRFFSRCGLPQGATRRRRATKRKPTRGKPKTGGGVTRDGGKGEKRGALPSLTKRRVTRIYKNTADAPSRSSTNDASLSLYLSTTRTRDGCPRTRGVYSQRCW